MSNSGVYEFLGDKNAEQWRGLLQPALRKIQKQVHPRFDIEDDTLAYLEGLIFSLLAQMCAAQPHVMGDVESYVQKNFTAPIDTWALSDAQLLMERAQKRRGVFIFPVERLFVLMQKEVFGYKIELNLIQYIMAILDYVSADILKLAGNFLKNTRKPAIIIRTGDVKVSMSADPALHALIQSLQEGQSPGKELHLENYTEMSERKPQTYDEILRQLIDEESMYVRHLNLILKVFMEPFQDRRLFPAPDVDAIFYNLTELHELSIKLLGDLDECIEMSGEIGGNSNVPQVGVIFEDIAECFEFEVYTKYACNYLEATCKLEELLADEEVVHRFKSSKISLFKEAMQYILPSSLLEPIYHCFSYFDFMEALLKSSTTEDDQSSLESAISCAFSTKMELERVCSRFLPKRKDESGMFGKGPGYGVALRKVSQIQQKVEGWDGPDIFSCCTKLIKEGTLGVIRDRRGQKTERHVFLLDGLAICCKTKSRGGSSGEYRLKEKINMRKVKLTDLEDADDLKYAFQLTGQDQPTITFYAISKMEKNGWMAALTLLLTCSTFDRLLDSKLREEEQNIKTLTPNPKEYQFAEDDSDENMIFDEVEAGKPSGGPGPPIKAGTIHKLVERLTYHEYADPSFVRTFLMTYRSFSEPQELLDLLISRFHIPMPIEMDDHDRRDPMLMKAVKRYKANYISPIQLRVFNVLRHWVEFHYYDFMRDKKLLDKLRAFVGSVKTKSMQKWVISINRAMQKKAEEDPQQNIKHVFSKEKEPVEWHIATKREDYQILTLHHVEIARQLTLIQSEYFRAIHPSELVDASWMKDEKKEKSSPNLLKLNRFETSISNWLSKEIVYMENFDERVALVSRLIDIMEELRRLNNFAGMFVINAAFESASVFRLKSTFKDVSQKRHQVLEDMKQIASSDKGYKIYKEKLRNIDPPCVPFLGMYMTWIVFIKDGSENNITGKGDQFINFKKRRKIADVLQEIQQYQNSPYALIQEASIQDWITSQDPVGNMSPNKWADMIFEQSRSIEPKDLPPKKVARQYKFDLRPPRGYSALGTLMKGRHQPKNPNLPSLPDSDHGRSQHESLSLTPPQSPLDNGVASSDHKRKSSTTSMRSGRNFTSMTSLSSAESPVLPPKPPKSSVSTSALNFLPPTIPFRSSSPPVNSTYPPRPGPKPGERKAPALPPDSDPGRRDEKHGRPPPPPPPGSSPSNHELHRPPPPLPEDEPAVAPTFPKNELRPPPHLPKGTPNNNRPPPCPPRNPDNNDIHPPLHPPRGSNNVLPLPDKPDKNKLPLPPRPKKLDNSAPPVPPRDK